LLVTLAGVILEFVVAPANDHDLTVAAEVLAEQRDLLALGDKAYYSAAVAGALHAEFGVTPFALPRANQGAPLLPAVVVLHMRCQQIIETVNEQLADQFHLGAKHAKTF
jgi:hypothetical protein